MRSTRTRCSTTAISPARRRSRKGGAKRRTPTSFRRSSAIRSPRSRCCGASRSAACASYELTRAQTIEGERFPAGTWVVPADQEFAALAREVLDVQKYPEIRESPGGPLDSPYDAAGWTLPLSMGVRTIYVADAAVRRSAREA